MYLSFRHTTDLLFHVRMYSYVCIHVLMHSLNHTTVPCDLQACISIYVCVYLYMSLCIASTIPQSRTISKHVFPSMISKHVFPSMYFHVCISMYVCMYVCTPVFIHGLNHTTEPCNLQMCFLKFLGLSWRHLWGNAWLNCGRWSVPPRKWPCCVCVCVCVYIYIYIYIYMCVCVCVCVYVYMDPSS